MIYNPIYSTAVFWKLDVAANGDPDDPRTFFSALKVLESEAYGEGYFVIKTAADDVFISRALALVLAGKEWVGRLPNHASFGVPACWALLLSDLDAYIEVHDPANLARGFTIRGEFLRVRNEAILDWLNAL